MQFDCNKVKLIIRALNIFVIVTIVSACAHPITIVPDKTPERVESKLSSKKVAYLMTESNRNLEVTTLGGGGDKLTYYPYRDSEKAIRDALRAVYSDVTVISSSSNEVIKNEKISYIYTPVISTISSSDSAFTWPPTYFRIELTCKVNDVSGRELTILKVEGSGRAEFSEFKINTGLAGTRANSDLSEKLRQEILKNPDLY